MRIFWTQDNFGNNKILLGQFETQTKKGGTLKIKFYRGIVAAATISDYLVNTYLWTNFPLIKKDCFDGTTLLDFFKIYEFPNARFIHFNHW